MPTIYVLDRYTNKNVAITGISESKQEDLSAGQKVIYRIKDKDAYDKLSIGVYIGHDIDTDRQGLYEGILEGEEKKYFDKQHAFAQKLFPDFKKTFKENFAGSIPVTAKFHIYADQVYFYFYSEERYVFSDYVKDLRKKVGKNIFLYQIGARDMIKMSPATDNIIGCNGKNLCCKSTRALPSIEMENVLIQNLEGRDIERLKGRCGKLKCSLIYEVEQYIEESKKYPEKGDEVTIAGGGCDNCGVCTSYNIMTGDVTIKMDDGVLCRVPLAQVKEAKKREKK